MEPLTLLHRQTMADCTTQLEANPLTEALKSKVDALELKIKTFEDTPEADRKEDDKKKIETISGKLAHAIKDHVETNLPDDDNPPVPPVPPVEEPPVPPVTTEEPPVPPITPDDNTPPVTTDEPIEEESQGRTLLERNRLRRERGDKE